MTLQRPLYRQLVSDEDWERTPASVKSLVENLVKRVEQLEQQLGQLQDSEELTAQRLTQVTLSVCEALIESSPHKSCRA